MHAVHVLMYACTSILTCIHNFVGVKLTLKCTHWIFCDPLHHFIQHWTQLKQSGRGPWPEERSSHAACCLNYGQQYPQLLVYGGRNRENRPSEDVWILDVGRGNWKNVRIFFTRWACTTFGMVPFTCMCHWRSSTIYKASAVVKYKVNAPLVYSYPELIPSTAQVYKVVQKPNVKGTKCYLEYEVM